LARERATIPAVINAWIVCRGTWRFMDGNGRWAAQRGQLRVAGHRAE